MTIPTEKIVVYNWDDIQLYLCEKMGIKDEDFRDYHKVIGGAYKDFWHVWLWLTDNKVGNGYIVPFYFGDTGFADATNTYFRNTLSKEFGEWAFDILPALDALHLEVDSDMIYIEYIW